MSDWEAFGREFEARDGVNCQWRIAKRPVGNVSPDDFEWHEEPLQTLKDGEVLLETMYLGLAPVTGPARSALDVFAMTEALSPEGEAHWNDAMTQVERERHDPALNRARDVDL